MSASRQVQPVRSRPRPGWILAGLAVLGLVAGVAIWMNGVAPGSRPADAPAEAPLSMEQQYPGLDLTQPSENFATLRFVADHGGDEASRTGAIGWLDRQARRRTPLTADEEAYLLAMIEQGGHADWAPGFRQHLYNSAFNALHISPHIERFARLLHEMAICNPDKTLRLYALQHIGLMRQAGRLTGPPAREIHATLMDLAADSGEEVSGTAIALLVDWRSGQAPVDPQVIDLALDVAADAARSLDIRVTAIHAAGEDALLLARKLATDPTTPVLLRKAAIHRIGRHGDAGDFPELDKLRGESSRLAQAAGPALKAIRDRLANPEAPAPIPF